jgi:hypothetical protein
MNLLIDMIDDSCWVYADYRIGDILIFDIKTIHASFRYNEIISLA